MSYSLTADAYLQEEDVVAPEVMAAAGLWEDIQLPARRQVQSLSVSRLSFSSYAVKPYHPHAATIASTSCCHYTCRAAFLSDICAHRNSALCMAVAWSGHRCVLCSSTFNSIHASLSMMLQLTVCTVKTQHGTCQTLQVHVMHLGKSYGCCLIAAVCLKCVAVAMQVVDSPAAKSKPVRASKKSETKEELSEAETEDFNEGNEHDSDLDESPGSTSNGDDTEASRSGNRSKARPQRTSKNRAAQAIRGSIAAIDLDDDDSNKENAASGAAASAADKESAPVSAADKAKELQAMSSRLRAARANRAAGNKETSASGAEDERVSDADTLAASAARKKSSSRTPGKSRSSSPATSDSGTAGDRKANSNISDVEEDSPAPALLKSCKGKNSAAEAGRHNSRESSVAIRSNSEVSEGWVVRCKCGATDDDGEAMTECEGGCKTWVHDACYGLVGGGLHWCDSCKENVQTSKPAKAVSYSNADIGVSQSTPLAVDSLPDASDTNKAVASAAAAIASVSSADGSNSNESSAAAEAAKASSSSDASRASAAEGPRASSNSPVKAKKQTAIQVCVNCTPCTSLPSVLSLFLCL